jgi:hypothetical protein
VEEERGAGVEAHAEAAEEGTRWGGGGVDTEEGMRWRVDAEEERASIGVGK